MTRRLVAFVVGCSVAACVDAYPFELSTPASWHGDRIWQQRITATFEGQSRTSDAVLQKIGDSLTVVLLSPLGGATLSLRQDGDEVWFAAATGFSPPLPPRTVLVDVQRCYFPLTDLGPLRSGDRAYIRSGERIREVWQDGRLRRRSFERLDGRPQGLVVVEYQYGDDAFPSRVTLSNRWLGYQLNIETSVRQTQ